MGILNKIKQVFSDPPAAKRRTFSLNVSSNKLIDFIIDKRGYAAAKQDRLTADWLRSTESANKEVQNGLRIIRDRARDLYNNNDYSKKFVELCVQNIVGPNGIVFQNKSKNKKNKLDVRANDLIEDAWRKWTKKEYCTVTGKQNFTETCKLILTHVARDGEMFIRKIKNKNDFGFSLQLVEPDHVDEKLWNDKLKNGHYIRMGIEFDAWGKPVKYFVKKETEKNYMGSGVNESDYEIIPADQMIHIHRPARADQARSVSWLVQSMIRLKMLDGYEEAALINARVSAAKMGFFTSETDNANEYNGDNIDSDENISMVVEPGKMEQLPPGIKFETWNPEYPTAQHGDFIKKTLMGISSGLGVSYSSISSDLEGVNYSSIRAGLVEEREQWKSLQNWFIDSFLTPVFESWLSMALTKGAIALPIEGYDKFNAPHWMPKRWAWVDPLKDIAAIEKAIALKLKTRRKIMAEENNDFEDTIDEIALENEYIKEKLNETEPPKDSGSASNDNDDDANDNDEEDNGDEETED